LRAMGQKDPLVEWQRDGFDMFGQMMHGVWSDFIRYVMHVQVQVNQPQPAAATTAGPPDGRAADAADGSEVAEAAEANVGSGGGDGEGDAALRDVQYSSPDDGGNAGGAASIAAAARAGDAGAQPQRQAAGAGGGNGAGAAAPTATATQTNTPVVKSEWDKTPRNAPCPCGSGKKFKHCHGR
ncbi:MAG TPA: SEC-C metal-binding domain-containing protein, partial [Acidimicrobiales bacterium]|nr:SEC-C metal-binding domain-containing protein [Acidimicrobiales bacterium]